MPTSAYRIKWTREHTSVFYWQTPRVTQFKSYSVHKTWEAAVSHLRDEYEKHERQPSRKLAVPGCGWQEPIEVFPVQIEDEGLLKRELAAHETVRVDRYKFTGNLSMDELADLVEEISQLKTIGKSLKININGQCACPAHPPEHPLTREPQRTVSVKNIVAAVVRLYSQPHI
jgi:hypothetical protein